MEAQQRDDAASLRNRLSPAVLRGGNRMSSTSGARQISGSDLRGTLFRVLWTMWASLAVMSCSSTQQPQQRVVILKKGQITNYETKGNLKSFHHLNCVSVAALTTAETPADLYPAVRTCVDHGDFQRAARLWMIASLYGRFDTLRVLDVSAHQAILVLRQTFLGPLDQGAKDQLQATIEAITAPDQLAGFCAQMRGVGAPTYYPTYMLQHGMSAFTGTGGGLKRDFNAAQAWDSSVTDYLHCPAPSH